MTFLTKSFHFHGVEVYSARTHAKGLLWLTQYHLIFICYHFHLFLNFLMLCSLRCYLMVVKYCLRCHHLTYRRMIQMWLKLLELSLSERFHLVTILSSWMPLLTPSRCYGRSNWQIGWGPDPYIAGTHHHQFHSLFQGFSFLLTVKEFKLKIAQIF